jgi:oxygen-independent coproporphyrinogen-3 oxidase
VTARLAARKLLGSFLDRPGAYLHVPFCERPCPFCPYNKVRYETARARRYFTALREEVEAFAGAAETPFSSLYVGGGTPSLCLDELGEILPRLAVEGEVAIEMMPSHVDEESTEQLRALGVTHVSLGLQSFDAGMLRHLRRPNSPEDNLAAIDAASGRFDCVDADLIFDVGFAAPEVLLSDLETCFALGVDQVSTYPLMRFGYTPFGKAAHEPAAEHALLHRAETLAVRHGYERSTVWTFNRRGSRRYTSITRELYVGLGAGAASYSGSAFWVNHFSPERYGERLAAGELPIARRMRMPRLLSAAYWLFWQAYRGEVDLGRFHSLFDDALPLALLLRLGERRGLLDVEGERVRLTGRGLEAYHDLERWVTCHYIEPLWREMLEEHEHRDAPPSRAPKGWTRIGRMLRQLSPFLPG